MDEYYAYIKNLFDKRNLLVFPVLNGIYVWENDNDCEILYEVSKYKRYLRAGFKNGRILNNDELAKHSTASFVEPRSIDIDGIVKALRKIENINGYILIRDDNQIVFLQSYTCYLACIQFKSWVHETVKHCSSMNDFQNIVESMHTDHETRLFVCSHTLYFFHEIRLLFDSHQIENKNIV